MWSLDHPAQGVGVVLCDLPVRAHLVEGGDEEEDFGVDVAFHRGRVDQEESRAHPEGEGERWTEQVEHAAVHHVLGDGSQTLDRAKAPLDGVVGRCEDVRPAGRIGGGRM